MKTDTTRPQNTGPTMAALALSREAQIAYKARAAGPAPLPGAVESGRDLGLELQATRVESHDGPTVLLSGTGDRPGSTMLLLSTGLFRRLLATAGTRSPRQGGRRSPGRLDIRV